MLKDMTPTATGSCFLWKAILYGRSTGAAFPHMFLPEARRPIRMGPRWEISADHPGGGMFDLAILWQAGFDNVTSALGNHPNALLSSASCVLITNAGLARCTRCLRCRCQQQWSAGGATISAKRLSAARNHQCAPRHELLLRHTGMRIGECVNLPFDCLRTLRTRSVGHPRTGQRKLKTRTMGACGIHGLPDH